MFLNQCLILSGFSVTNFGINSRLVYEDGALNAPVDVLYVDLSRNTEHYNYFDDVIDENTITILRFRYPVVTGNLPSFIKNKYQYLKFICQCHIKISESTFIN